MTGNSPAVLTTGNGPAVPMTENGPAVLMTENGPAVLTTGNGPAVLTTGNGPAVLTTGNVVAGPTMGNGPRAPPVHPRGGIEATGNRAPVVLRAEGPGEGMAAGEVAKAALPVDPGVPLPPRDNPPKGPNGGILFDNAEPKW
jgi:hypothetical protein